MSAGEQAPPRPDLKAESPEKGFGTRVETRAISWASDPSGPVSTGEGLSGDTGSAKTKSKFPGTGSTKAIFLILVCSSPCD
jgi:hypothetical protein